MTKAEFYEGSLYDLPSVYEWSYRADNDFDLNGHVFSMGGDSKRSFLLGDGIQDVQTTGDGRIWTSYFDEGIFGNFGWNHPIGVDGLIQWDRLGNKLYQYSPKHPLDAMDSCYALNVVSNRETWCYYYTEFPLVRIYGEQIAGQKVVHILSIQIVGPC